MNFYEKIVLTKKSPKRQQRFLNYKKVTKSAEENWELSLSRRLGVALSKLQNNKSPESDGLTTNFKKFFWIDIKDILYQSYINSYRLQNPDKSAS